MRENEQSGLRSEEGEDPESDSKSEIRRWGKKLGSHFLADVALWGLIALGGWILGRWSGLF